MWQLTLPSDLVENPLQRCKTIETHFRINKKYFFFPTGLIEGYAPFQMPDGQDYHPCQGSTYERFVPYLNTPTRSEESWHDSPCPEIHEPQQVFQVAARTVSSLRMFVLTLANLECNSQRISQSIAKLAATKDWTVKLLGIC